MINANNRITTTSSMMNHCNKLMTYFLPRGGRFLAARRAGFSVQRRNQMLLSALLLLSSFAMMPDAFAQSAIVSNLTATPGDTTVTLTWEVSTREGPEISNYSLIVLDDQENPPDPKPAAPPIDVLSHTVPGLINGRTYSFQLSATNALNQLGIASDEIVATPNGAVDSSTIRPTPVTDLEVLSVGDGTVTLSWTAPVANDGPSITKQEVLIEDGTEQDETDIREVEVPITNTTFTVPNLTNGVSHKFKVRVTNPAGSSVSTEIEATPNIPVVPEKIIGLKVLSVGDRTVTLGWDLSSASGGGREITSYGFSVHYPLEPGEVEGEGRRFSTPAPTLDSNRMHTVSGLPNRIEFDFVFTPVYANGLGTDDSRIKATPGIVTKPAATTLTVVSVGDRTVTLSWTKPDNGGSDLIGYSIKVSPREGVQTTVTPSLDVDRITIPNLDNGIFHNFEFTSENRLGDSPSATASATPVAPVAPVGPVDTTKPVIIRTGPATIILEVGSSYTDEMPTATDNAGEDISDDIEISGSVDTSRIGTYTLTYTVMDSTDRAAEAVTRTVTIVSASPSANAGPDQSVAPGANVVLSGSGTDFKDDAAEEALTYAWALTSGGPLASSGLSDEDTATARFTAATTVTSIVTYVFTLTVTDSDDNSDTDTVTISVTSEVAITKDIDKQNKVILASVARSIADQNINAISTRISEAGGATPKNSLGGNTNVADILKSMDRLNTDSFLNAEEALGNSRFAVALDGIGGAFWGKIDYQKFKGDAQSIKYDGALFSSTLGVEGQVNDQTRLGLTLSRNKSDIDYTDSVSTLSATSAGDYDVVMLSVNPYVSWKPSEGVDLWGTFGYGQGDLELILTGSDRLRSSKLRQKTAAAGGSGLLLDRGAIELRLKGEVLKTRLEVDKSEGIAALALDAMRLRVGLEGSHALSLEDGATLDSSVELGVRYDGGDGQTGSKGEVGGRLEYSNGRGLTLEGNARVLVGGGSYDEWGLGGLLKFQPSIDGRGVSFNLGLGQGNTVTQDIWKNTLANKSTATVNVSTTSINFGYGITAPHWLGGSAYGILTPYTEVRLGNSNSYGLGLDWRIDPSVGFKLNVKNQSDSVNSVNLEGEIGF